MSETEPKSTRAGWLLAGTYFVFPLLLVGIVYWRWRCWFSSDNPVYLWRFFYCCLAGYWGLAVRAYERREELSPWPDYFLLYPLGLVMNAFAVFTTLTLFQARLGFLFWTAALPLCMVLGRYCHPREWLLTKLIDKAKDK
jgi:hypothetical protein